MYPVNKVLKATVRLSAIYSYIAIIKETAQEEMLFWIT